MKTTLKAPSVHSLGKPWCCCNSNELWAPKTMYAITSGSKSAFLNYMPVFYQHTAQFSKVQIGVLQTLPSVCAMIAPPVWGAIADAIQNQRLVHLMAIVTGAVFNGSVQFFRSYQIIMMLVVLGGLFGSPAASLLDHAVLHMLSKVSVDGEYGKQRLFGAVGYGAGAYVTGVVVTCAGITWSFDIGVVLALASIAILRFIPTVNESQDEDNCQLLQCATESSTEAQRYRSHPSLVDGMRELGGKVDVLVLLIVVFLMSLMYGVLSSYLTLNLYNLSGGNSQIIGIAIVCETMSEIPAFFYSQPIINRLGTVNVLLLSIAGYAARITYMAVMTNPWGAIPFEFLHGVTFGIAWAACTQYIYQTAPRGCEGTVIGILNAVQNGLGRAVGTLIGGYFYENYNAKMMWLVTDLGVPLSIAGVAVFAYFMNKEEIVLEETILENAELFSPHSADPSALNSYGSVKL